MIRKAIERAARRRLEKGWTKTYWAIDLHDVVINGSYKQVEESYEFCNYADMVLRWLTKQPDHVLILWTSSHEPRVQQFLDVADMFGIRFNYVNRNPEIHSTKLASFREKFYFDILLEDKAGFDKMDDWHDVWQAIVKCFSQ